MELCKLCKYTQNYADYAEKFALNSSPYMLAILDSTNSAC